MPIHRKQLVINNLIAIISVLQSIGGFMANTPVTSIRMPADIKEKLNTAAEKQGYVSLTEYLINAGLEKAINGKALLIEDKPKEVKPEKAKKSKDESLLQSFYKKYGDELGQILYDQNKGDKSKLASLI